MPSSLFIAVFPFSLNSENTLGPDWMCPFPGATNTPWAGGDSVTFDSSKEVLPGSITYFADGSWRFRPNAAKHIGKRPSKD